MLKKPDDLARILAASYQRNWIVWLGGGGQWPLRIPLGKPGEKDWEESAAGVHSWIGAWKGIAPQTGIEWEGVRFHHRGEFALPVAMTFCEPGEVARLIEKETHWNEAKALRARFLDRWPGAVQEVDLHLGEMLGWEEADRERFEAVVEWLLRNPDSGLFRRAVPVRGIHSKWIEARLGAIVDIVHYLSGRAGSITSLESLGLRGPPRLVRWRALCPELRNALGGIDSLATSIEDLSRFRVRPARVLVIENLETFLALPDLPGTMALLGMGYAVDAISLVSWIQEVPLGYWGDLDTHGFAILNRARTHAPRLESLLMDKSTLLEHRDLWSHEASQHKAQSLERLDAKEGALYSDLRENRLGIGIRLEQERIPIDWFRPRLESWAEP